MIAFADLDYGVIVTLNIASRLFLWQFWVSNMRAYGSRNGGESKACTKRERSVLAAFSSRVQREHSLSFHAQPRLNPRRIRCEVIVKFRSNDASNRFDYESCSRRLSSNFRREYKAKLCHGLYIHRLNEFEQILLLSTLLILSHTFF